MLEFSEIVVGRVGVGVRRVLMGLMALFLLALVCEEAAEEECRGPTGLC
jgi:hypothetical protein